MPVVEDAIFDEAGALEMLDGDRPLLRELLTLFIAAAPALVDDARRASVRGDAVTLARAAHRLRGNAGQVGGQRVSALALTLEQAARTGDLAAAARALDALGPAVDTLCRRVTAALAD